MNLCITAYRGLDPDTTLVRVSCDGGGGSFKVIANVFNPNDEQNKGEKHSGQDYACTESLNIENSFSSRKTGPGFLTLNIDIIQIYILPYT